MQKVRCYFYKLQLIVSIKFQILLQILKFYFTFPLQYFFTINHQKILNFEGGPPLFKQYTTCIILLKYINFFILQGFHINKCYLLWLNIK